MWTAKLEKFAAKIENVPLEQITQTASVVLDDVRKILESKDTQDLFKNANGALVGAVVHACGVVHRQRADGECRCDVAVTRQRVGHLPRVARLGGQ